MCDDALCECPLLTMLRFSFLDGQQSISSEKAKVVWCSFPCEHCATGLGAMCVYKLASMIFLAP